MVAVMLWLIVAAFASHAWHGNWWHARDSAWNVSKLAVLFLLVICLVNSKSRLLTFVRLQVLVICSSVTVALADYYNLIEINSIGAIADKVYGSDDEGSVIERLRGTGIFEDPNDLGMIIVLGLVLSCCALMQSKSGWVRYLWLFPISLELIGLAHTYSRGALLSLAAAVPAWLYIRGGKKAAFWGTLGSIPILLLLFSGRMTEVDAVFEGTGQSRIRIWADALYTFRTYPAFGIGEGMFVEEFGIVTHNSFLQVFAELGLFGGTPLLALFWIGLVSLLPKVEDPYLQHLRGFIFAALVGYGTGLLSLSRQFEGPTFLVLGLVAATINTSHRPNEQKIRMNGQLVVIAFFASTFFLIAISILVRILIAR